MTERRHCSLLTLLLATTTLMTSSPALHTPALIDLSSDVDVFFDPLATDSSTASSASSPRSRHFRHLVADTKDDNFLYVGAINHVYRLDASYIPENYIKSGNLSQVAADAISENFFHCLARGKDLSFSCQNHVRAVIRTADNRLFVCSTGVYSPMIYYLSPSSLEVLTVDTKGGRAKCPYDPASNYTIVHVENGNPGNIPSIYTGTVTDFSNSDTVIFRPPLVGEHFKEYRLLRTEQDSRWLSDPHFVGSFDVGEFVYFFFREHAVEQANCGKVIFSRVARVCKNDEGGTSLSMDYRWTTFLKARLNCSVPGGQDLPFYFNEIYDIRYNKTEKTFYGLFRTIQGGFWGSAVCSFTLAAIENVLNRSPFKSQQSFETGWFPISERDTPSPRPGQCTRSSLELSTSNLLFIKSHPLLHDTVDSTHGNPLYYSKDDLALTGLAVHSATSEYRVLFLASSRGYIHKVAQWIDDAGRVQFNTVAILRPRHSGLQAIHQILVHTVSAIRSTFLYISTDDAVTQLPLDNCFRYSRCQQCVRDPYCSWDSQQSTCKPYHPSLIQMVTSSSEDVCSKLCSSNTRYYVTSREVLQGVPVHFNCTPTCLSIPSSSSSSYSSLPSSTAASQSSLKVVWHFSDASSARMLRMDYAEHFLTQENGLILLDVKAHHHGNFTCSINGHVTARHELRVLPCKYGADREETWRTEFAKWCHSYTAYTEEYNQWLCLKKQCLKEKCIPQNIINKCSLDRHSRRP